MKPKSRKTRTPLFILLLVLIYPLGLLLMWLRTKWKIWIKIVVSLPLVLFILFIALYIYVIRPYQASGDSMYPNVKDRQYMLAYLLADKTKLQRGQIITFKRGPMDMDFFARIIGVPGDKIELSHGQVYLNGTLLTEAYVASDQRTFGNPNFLPNDKELIIPDESYFVMGDRREFSSDSRDKGFVEVKDITGPIIRIW